MLDVTLAVARGGERELLTIGEVRVGLADEWRSRDQGDYITWSQHDRGRQ